MDNWIPVIQILSPFVIAVVAYFFASKQYYNQKSYDEIKRRYLDESIDSIASTIENSLGNISANWVSALQITKSFKYLKHSQKLNSATNYYCPYNTKDLRIIAHDRLMALIGDNIFFELHQIQSAFEINKYNLLSDDFHVAITKYCDGSLCDISDEKHSETHKTYSELIEPIQRDSYAYYPIVKLLNKLSFIFEREKYSYSQIDSFKDRADVKSIINEAKTLYEKLEEND